MTEMKCRQIVRINLKQIWIKSV